MKVLFRSLQFINEMENQVLSSGEDGGRGTEI